MERKSGRGKEYASKQRAQRLPAEDQERFRSRKEQPEGSMERRDSFRRRPSADLPKDNVNLYLSPKLLELADELAQGARMSVRQYLNEALKFVLLTQGKRMGKSDRYVSEFVNQNTKKVSTWKADPEAPEEESESGEGERSDWKRRPSRTGADSGDRGGDRRYSTGRKPAATWRPRQEEGQEGSADRGYKARKPAGSWRPKEEGQEGSDRRYSTGRKPAGAWRSKEEGKEGTGSRGFGAARKPAGRWGSKPEGQEGTGSRGAGAGRKPAGRWGSKPEGQEGSGSRGFKTGRKPAGSWRAKEGSAGGEGSSRGFKGKSFGKPAAGKARGFAGKKSFGAGGGKPQGKTSRFGAKKGK